LKVIAALTGSTLDRLLQPTGFFISVTTWGDDAPPSLPAAFFGNGTIPASTPV
jgi:hypothetical protein